MKTLPDQSQSSLLALPPEIRNCIFELAFSDTIIILDEETRALALLCSCRQIRSEAYDVFYSTVIFEANTLGSAFDFIVNLSPQPCASISELR